MRSSDGVVTRARLSLVTRAPKDTCQLETRASRFGERSFFASLRAALCPGGAVALNVIGSLGTEGVLCDVARAARAELDGVRLVPVVDFDEAFSPEARRNVVVVGTRAA